MGIYAWGNTNVVGNRVVLRKGHGFAVRVVNSFKKIEREEDSWNSHLLMLCDRARAGCRAAARILSRHGIRQYTQEEIDAVNSIHGEKISENKRQAATV